jgi:hypothetical protein
MVCPAVELSLVYDHDAFAREACEVFRPGGPVSVTEVFRDGVRLPRFETTAPQPWRPLTVRRLVCALDQAGLTDIEVADWPGDGVPRVREARDRALGADITDGRR